MFAGGVLGGYRAVLSIGGRIMELLIYILLAVLLVVLIFRLAR